jgi:hypothetical protein
MPASAHNACRISPDCQTYAIKSVGLDTCQGVRSQCQQIHDLFLLHFVQKLCTAIDQVTGTVGLQMLSDADYPTTSCVLDLIATFDLRDHRQTGIRP